MPIDDLRLREATAEDLDVLTAGLFEAMNWNGTVRLSAARIMAIPELAHYVTGWPLPGDFGLVALAGANPVGVAWLRVFAASDPGYGFVAADVPELSMAVFPDYRGQGVGTVLMNALIDHAGERGLRALSLSVEDNNRARALYERSGFKLVRRDGNSDVMLLAL